MTVFEHRDYKNILTSCFGSDQDLLDNFHVEAPADIETCVKRTLTDMEGWNTFKFYALNSGGQLAGFFGKEEINGVKYLTSFFLKPEFRTEEYKKEFWRCVKENIGDDFCTGIYKKNVRADKFLSKQKHSRLTSNNMIVYNINL